MLNHTKYPPNGSLSHIHRKHKYLPCLGPFSRSDPNHLPRPCLNLSYSLPITMKSSRKALICASYMLTIAHSSDLPNPNLFDFATMNQFQAAFPGEAYTLFALIQAQYENFYNANVTLTNLKGATSLRGNPMLVDRLVPKLVAMNESLKRWYSGHVQRTKYLLQTTHDQLCQTTKSRGAPLSLLDVRPEMCDALQAAINEMQRTELPQGSLQDPILTDSSREIVGRALEAG